MVRKTRGAERVPQTCKLISERLRSASCHGEKRDFIFIVQGTAAAAKGKQVLFLAGEANLAFY